MKALKCGIGPNFSALEADSEGWTSPGLKHGVASPAFPKESLNLLLLSLTHSGAWPQVAGDSTVTASHASTMVLLGEMDPAESELNHPLQHHLLAAGFSNMLRKGQ